MLREFEILVGEEVAESVADALLAAGALSVAVEDVDAGGEGEQPLYGEPGLGPTRAAWPHNRLVVLIDEATDPHGLVASVFPGPQEPPAAVLAVREVADQDWVRITQEQFSPTRIGARLWIVPSWHEPPDPQALLIRLDPGVAFGTGTHPTTRLVLQWLEANPPAGRRVLDYGCGSGILAIAAAKLGAARVIGTDIDAQAVHAARANAAANGTPGDYTAPDALPDGAFDLVLANILTNPLKLLAPLLLGRVAPGGSLVLSGVLQRQAGDVIGAYAQVDPGVALTVWRSDEGWVCLQGTRD